MEPAPRRAWWTIAKLLLAAAIILAVGWQFYRDLSQLDWASLSVAPGWLVLSAGLYLAGLAFSAWFWVRLLRVFGQKPALLDAGRAYYIGHLGKYVPGKAWALLLRGTTLRGP